MINVGIGEYAITDKKDERIITHALGSCVAVIIYCTYNGVTSLAHVVLPRKGKYNNINKDAYFADETVNRLLNYYLIQLGCEKRFLHVTLVGGADSAREQDSFQVGRKNLEAVRKVLKERYIIFDDKDTGGNYSRTVEVHADSGKIHIRKSKMLI